MNDLFTSIGKIFKEGDLFTPTVVNDILERIPGPWNTPSPLEATVLYFMAQQSIGYIYEWGVWKGRSTAILKAGAGNNTIISQDHFLGDETGGKDSDLVAAFHNVPNTNILISDIHTFPSSIINWKLFSTLVYDAHHNFKTTMRALELPLIEVPIGSLLYIHDFKKFDTASVVDYITRSYPWTLLHLLDTRDGAIILRKG